MSRNPLFDEALFCRMLLRRIPNLGDVAKRSLLEHFDSIQDLFNSNRSFLVSEAGMSLDQVKVILDTDLHDEIRREQDEAGREGIQILCPESSRYPESLADLINPPDVLYVKGSLDGMERSLAVVGTRTSTHAAMQNARRFAADLASHQVTIISGMARGIDTAAHEGALKAEGRTIAVLGSGLRSVYPPENKALAERIAQRGALVSEYRLDEEPRNYHFPMRNRIISGLGQALLLVEAPRKSGSLITAELTLEQGKEVFAIPGPIHIPHAAGSNEWIKEGATCVTHPDDIRQVMGWQERFNRIAHEIPSFSFPEARNLLETLQEKGPQTFDDLSRELDLGTSELLARLTQMEVKGAIRKLAGTRYTLAESKDEETS